MSKAPNLVFERSLQAQGHRFIAGCDEVGRGALAGPVSVGMVVIDVQAQKGLRGVRDSKLLKAAEREALVPAIRRWAVGTAVGHATAAEVDSVGLIAALRMAGTRAWQALAAEGLNPEIVLLDGNHNWLSQPAQASLFDGIESVAAEPGGVQPSTVETSAAETEGASPGANSGGVAYGPACGAPVVTKIKADLQCLSVAAASVLAKVERDAVLTALHEQHPQYGWAINKGYATPAHRAAIAAGGPSPYHRLSWRLTALAELADEAAAEACEADVHGPDAAGG